jgi:hypothetical protein
MQPHKTMTVVTRVRFNSPAKLIIDDLWMMQISHLEILLFSLHGECQRIDRAKQNYVGRADRPVPLVGQPEAEVCSSVKQHCCYKFSANLQKKFQETGNCDYCFLYFWLFCGCCTFFTRSLYLATMSFRSFTSSLNFLTKSSRWATRLVTVSFCCLMPS